MSDSSDRLPKGYFVVVDDLLATQADEETVTFWRGDKAFVVELKPE